ncbi:FIST signal transduction protein [Spirochaeta thermophila]|uniref:FIST C-domain domain-containing protein n=1 Tax=Winmispira thermophila (strain ATCC 49972 / DSM 6192 / RI 19.B1) TaxID=665571 RepID=E0RTI2_WINT6|nr:FIST N-terminal domain-containing protein [Spirochaeta thermophila]ADN02213.1 hypothetical protein STHERM_c12720 [Spirochaeta thermophila DSM 6192]
MKYVPLTSSEALEGGKAALCYTTVEVSQDELTQVSKKYGIPLFGCTSFQGVFTPEGFLRGAHSLLWEKGDEVKVVPYLVECGPDDARMKVREGVERMLSEVSKPDLILMHATPGFEERVIEGVEDVLGTGVPIYGGSAADDDVSGKWRVFLNDVSTQSGALLVAMKHEKGEIYGGFLGGYFPSDKRGRVTRCEGRVIYEIDGRPAAEVYNEWTGGAIGEYLEKGGVVLGATTLRPLGRVIGDFKGIPQYLLSHPHMVFEGSRALSCFTEFQEGDEVVLMEGFKTALIDRTSHVYERAVSFHRRKGTPRGGILIYCGGCVGAVLDSVQEINQKYRESIGEGVPFIGAATFGEEGCMYTKEGVDNRHGNLMTDTIVIM